MPHGATKPEPEIWIMNGAPIYTAPLYRDLLAQGCDVTVFPSALATRLADVDYEALQARVVAAQERYHIERFLPAVTRLLTGQSVGDATASSATAAAS